MSAQSKIQTPKFIKCPQCHEQGFAQLLGYINYFSCPACGLNTPLRLLNKSINN